MRKDLALPVVPQSNASKALAKRGLHQQSAPQLAIVADLADVEVPEGPRSALAASASKGRTGRASIIGIHPSIEKPASNSTPKTGAPEGGANVRKSEFLIAVPTKVDEEEARIAREEKEEREKKKREKAAIEDAKKSKEAIWLEVFNKLRDDGKLHKDDVARALELGGIAAPNTDFIDEVYGKVCKFTQLDVQSFLRVVELYIARQDIAFAEAFKECDADGSGMIEAEELAELLNKFGIEPMTHVLSEVISEVDEDGRGTLDLEEFGNVMQILRSREGFTRKEYEDFMSIFSMFDRDSSGSMDTKELIAIMGWLGYRIDAKSMEDISVEVDVDKSGLIDRREFLMCMRKVREREVVSVKSAVSATDEDGSGTLSASELDSLLQALGYFPNKQAVKEAAEAAGLDPADEELDLSELFQLLGIFRQREGFTTHETTEIEEAFRKYEKEGVGEMSTLYVGKVLRWLGYPTPFEVQQHLITQVDMDESGKLDLPELRKMIRMYKDREVAEMKAVFELMSNAESRITKPQVDIALSKLEFDIDRSSPVVISDEDMVPSSDPAGACVDLAGFVGIAKRLRNRAREAFKSNGGFSVEELEGLRNGFKKYDKDGSGDISKKELISLIEDTFPEMASDKKFRPQLMKLVSEIDADGSGSLDFGDFVSLMQQLREIQDSERVQKEQNAMRETGFTATEVKEFREIFLASDVSESGELSLQEVTNMIRIICPMGDRNEKQFVEIFHSITDKQLRVEGHRDEADFPEFLWFMRKLLDINFANIQEATGAKPKA